MADKLADTGTRMGEHGRAIRDEAVAAAADGRSAIGAYADQAKQYAQQGYRYAVDKSKAAKEKDGGVYPGRIRGMRWGLRWAWASWWGCCFAAVAIEIEIAVASDSVPDG